MNKVSAWLLAIFLVIGGIFFMTVETVDTSEEPEDLAEISYEDLEEKHIYYVEDLVVLDCVAALEDGEVLYMAVLFQDKDGAFTVLNMPVNDSDDIWDDVNDYLDDSSMGYYDMGKGDLVVSGYVKAEKDVNVQGELYDYFDDWLTQYRNDVSMPVEASDLRFDFVCDEDGDPYAIAEGASTVGMIGGGLLIVLALVVLYFGALRKPKPAPVCSVPTYAPQQPDAAAAAPVAEQLRRYQALVESGVMTSEEYEQKRRELLGL